MKKMRNTAVLNEKRTLRNTAVLNEKEENRSIIRKPLKKTVLLNKTKTTKTALLNEITRKTAVLQ